MQKKKKWREREGRIPNSQQYNNTHNLSLLVLMHTHTLLKNELPWH